MLLKVNHYTSLQISLLHLLENLVLKLISDSPSRVQPVAHIRQVFHLLQCEMCLHDPPGSKVQAFDRITPIADCNRGNGRLLEDQRPVFIFRVSLTPWRNCC